jgi:two-component system cell cycle response regulator
VKAIQKKATAERYSPDQRRVLVIADEPDAALVSSLESAGFKIVGVSTSAAAPVSLTRARPHLAIASTDVRGLSLPELAQILNHRDDDLPFILVGSEAATLQARKVAMSAGASDYFQLPEQFELLTLRAKQLIKLRQRMNQLRGEADLDTLTGLANRRRFRVALTRELERWRRYGAPCALLLLDIDHMKKINDTYGHPAGDRVLREIAETLSKVCRDNDIAARLGGEEFALLCANVDATKGELAAKRLHEVLTQQEIEGVGRITVSIGVAACPEHANSERTLYAASDAALYVAKNEGRDRIAVAPLLQEELPAIEHRSK